MPSHSTAHPGLVVIGGGPAGLMAAETARRAGIAVDLYDAKGSVGRKVLIAGKGGLNLTHSEALPDFIGRYGARAAQVGGWLRDFGPADVRTWALGLGIDTFVGSSGRVFPRDLRAAPLLRGWVRRLREEGVRFHMQQRWNGWDADGALRFDSAGGELRVRAGAVLLAMGGGSWPQLGSDGSWVELLRARGIDVAPLQPSNCGFTIGWSTHMARHAGTPLKAVVGSVQDADGRECTLQGEAMLTATGIEGSLVYALSAPLRAQLAAGGSAVLELDLAPGRSLQRLERELAGDRGRRSIGEHLRRRAGLDAVKSALVFELLPPGGGDDAATLARTIKRLPLRLSGMCPLADAISTAGGVRLEALDEHLMLRALPGTFCAGEMLDWDAPTGGYLLTACLASGFRAGNAAAEWLQSPERIQA